MTDARALPTGLPSGWESVGVLERSADVVVHRARRAGVVARLTITRGGDADQDARFRAEVRRIDAACAGPGAPPILELVIDATRGVRAIVTRDFDRAVCDEASPRPLLDALALLDRAARALGRAHALGLGHGALSPRRLALLSEGAAIVDLVPAAMSALAREPGWSAPEQLEARASVDVARADVYALALSFVRAVSGRDPFAGASTLELYARVTDRIRRPTLGAASIPVDASVDRVLEKALAVDPELRYPNADAFWDALRVAVFAAPTTTVDPPRPRVPERATQARAPRPRAPASLVIGATAAIVALGIGAEALWRAARRPATPPAAIASPPPKEAAAPPPAPSPSPSAAPSASVVATRDDRPMVPVPRDVPVFFVDRTEVTVRAYRACVAAGACNETWRHASAYREDDPVRREWRCNYHRPGRDDHPINCVTFAQATAYCAWAGKRLPTADEWTRAARGDDARTYPWGEAMPRCRQAVFARYGPDAPGCSKQPVGTAPADAHPDTASPFGALDMAGSLWEWTTERSPRGFPFMRGGAWDSAERGITIESRLEQAPGNGDITLGFRCVRDASGT
ncbi:MAG: SUMF1/EgtB/PvdO family nonheme iron enzyme [Deltaproteobacteria bacterium]|nr:SUMF1/EgtB/PvdO family nonheme iron enzyme [Deltaproteobacteria bacterium]